MFICNTQPADISWTDVEPISYSRLADGWQMTLVRCRYETTDQRCANDVGPTSCYNLEANVVSTLVHPFANVQPENSLAYTGRRPIFWAHAQKLGLGNERPASSP